MHFCMGQSRVELLTPSLSEKCSNRLSYWPKKREREEERGKIHSKKSKTSKVHDSTNATFL